MPETIGQQLKTARQARNLTFEKVTQATHIQARLLEAMEADDFEALPSPVQGRAFLRLYAGFLDLSLDEMIAHQRQAVAESDPAIHSDNPIPHQEPTPGAISPDLQVPVLEPVEETPPNRFAPILEKLQGLFQRLGKPSQPSGQPFGTGQATQLSLPLVDPEPASGNPLDPADPPAQAPAAGISLLADAVEAAAQAPATEGHEESPSPAGFPLEQPESQRIFASIGQSLRQRRESLSLTLEEIERHTHVRTHYLQALELGDFEHLPSSVQTRGMLNNYAHFLDMDLDAVLLQFAEGLQAKRLEQQPQTVKKPAATNAAPAPRINPPSGLRRYLSMDILVGGGLILVLLGFAIWGTSRVISLRSVITPQSTAQSISDILAGSSGTLTPTPTPSLVGTQTILPTEGVTVIGTIPAAGPGPVQVVVVALQQSYLRVTVDGKSQFDGRILEGTAYSFSGNNQIELLTGNGAGISVLFNQGNLGPMGRFGEVVDRIYTATAILNPTPTKTPTPTISPTPTITPRQSPTPTRTKTLLVSSATP